MKALLAMLALSLLSASAGAALPEKQATALTRQLQAVVSDPVLPLASLSVVAIRNGEIVYSQQLGSKRMVTATAKAQAADANTMYRIASISKMVTALGTMKMVEQGRLSLDADVSDYLGYRLRNPNFPDHPITLRMLLTHTSSLLDGAGISWGPKVAIRDVLLPGGALYDKGAMWSTSAAPGQYFDYGNLNWGVIATVMERASGERFDRLMRRLIFDPMELKAGFYLADFAPADIGDIATLYRKRIKDGAETWNLDGPWIAQSDDFGTARPVAPAGLENYVVGTNGTIFGPQGSLRISANELAKLMLMLMNEGSYANKQILKPGTVATMLARQWTLTGDATTSNGNSWNGLFNGWGLGNQHFLDISSVKEGHASGDRLVERGQFKGVGHVGFSWGLKSAFVFDPQTRNGMIYVTSGVGADPELHPGQHSSHARFEERITDLLYRGAIANP